MQVSIIIPVYKEQEAIVHTLAAMAGLLDSIPHEILVVDGEPGGTTLSFLETRTCPQKDVRLLTSARGRGPQLNTGAKAARGDLLFFVHADSRPDQAGVEEMATAWQASSSALFCGTFDLAIDSARPIFRIIEKTASLRSRLTRIPYGDQGIFMSRVLFEKVGGFPDQPLMEDVGLMAAVKKTGIKPVFLNWKMLTSARRWETRGIAKTTLSNWVFISLYLLGVSPEKLVQWYYK